MWLKDGRMIAAAVVAFVAGFVLALVIFGKPWHLEPDWGDIPTWILAGLALAAGTVGFIQLDILRRQFQAERRQAEADRQRDVKRDQLLDKQLAEAERRSLYDRRSQAEGVVLFIQPWGMDYAAVVHNKSRRPITDITCSVLSDPGRKTVVEPTETAWVMPSALGPGEAFDLDFIQSGTRYKSLKPDTACAFIFKGSTADVVEASLVAWFTDDAECRWHLDDIQHLAETTSDEYKR